MVHWLDALWERYPRMQPQDVVKTLFQSLVGCGHLLADEETVVRRIEAETATLQPDHDEPLWEAIGFTYARLNLRRALAEGLPARWIARMMLLSCQDQPAMPRSHLYDTLCEVPERVTRIPQDMLREAAAPLMDPDWLPGHSVTYHHYYKPAYRVISLEIARTVLPVLTELLRLPDKPCTTIAIDGMCASGKSTLAERLAMILDAPAAHMDHFFTPHPQKTPERLAQPGGNADVERFCEEFLTPYLTQGHVSYRPYDCHADAFAEPIDVPAARYAIIEGTYCLHPLTGRPYDVQVFTYTGPSTQQERILMRDGEEMLERFITTWIPLEMAYFLAFRLPDARCLKIHT